MRSNLVSVQKIIDIQPIPNADKIEVATCLGWKCVVKKDEKLKVGDLVVYFEVDSICPQTPTFEFLRDVKFRIKTRKFRKQVSQGLILPLSILPKGDYKEGDDVTKILGVKQYNPQEEAEEKLMELQSNIYKNRIDKFFKRFPWYRRLVFKKDKMPFPQFMRKTDEDRIQLRPHICENNIDRFFVTEKLDGQNGNFFLIRNKNKWQFWKPYIFGVCSRNYQLCKPDNSSYWTIAKQENIEKKLKECIGEHEYIVLQGEIIGNKIQGNKYNVDGYNFYVFNIFVDNYQFNQLGVIGLCAKMLLLPVPSIDTMFKLKPNIDEMVEYAKGKSQIADIQREGIVVRNYENNISFKVINPDFLLKYDE
jgi:tRNA-binding EMAP/Myf-like protein